MTMHLKIASPIQIFKGQRQNRPLLMALICIICFSLSLNIAHAIEKYTIFTEELAPLQYVENGTVSGFTTDKVTTLFKLANVEADIQVVPWARALKIVNSRPNTFIYSLARFEEREQEYQWISKVVTLNFAFIGLKDTHVISSYEDTKKLRFGSVRGDFAHEHLKKNNFIENHNYKLSTDYYRLLKLLYMGKVDAVVSDIKYLKGMATKLGFEAEDLTVLYPLPDQTISLYLAANKSSEPQLISRLKHAEVQLNHQQ